MVKSKKPMSAWQKHVQLTFREQRKKNPKIKFSHALRIAAKNPGHGWTGKKKK
jgi:hypothetical protein